MTREEIIKLAREAGMRDYCDSWTVEDDPTRKRPKQIQTDNLARFAVLVAAASASVEREACAEICEDLNAPDYLSMSEGSAWDNGALMCADAIRARGQA